MSPNKPHRHADSIGPVVQQSRRPIRTGRHWRALLGPLLIMTALNGTLAFAQTDASKELERLNAAISANTAPLLYKRGDLYLRTGELDKAVADYTEILKSQPDDIKAHYRLALAYRVKGDPKAAIAEYDKIVTLQPQEADAYNGRGLVRLSTDPKGALSDFSKAIQAMPDDAFAYFNRAAALHLQKDDKAALLDYDKAIAIDKRAAYLTGRGQSYAALGDEDKALADFNEAIQLDGKYPVAYEGRGKIRLAHGQFAVAIRDLSQAIRLNPTDSEALFNRGMAYYRNGDTEKALYDLTETISYIPLDANLHTVRALIKLKMGWTAGAFDDANRALLLKPGAAGAEQVKLAARQIMEGRPVTPFVPARKIADRQASPALATSAAPDSPINGIISEYRGTYTCSQGDTNLTLQFLRPSPGSEAVAVFKFGPSSPKKSIPSGAFLLRGVADLDNGKLDLHPLSWLSKPPGYVMVGLTGNSDDGEKTFKGQILFPGCTKFSVTRAATTSAAPN